LPDLPDYRENRVYDELRYILGAGKTRVGTYVCKTEITPQVVNDILVGTSGPMAGGNGRNLYAFGYIKGAVAELVGIEGGVVSGVINLESSGVEASDWRPRHDEQYHEA
jgi:hypothetical protein